MESREVLDLLEVTASERPELLPALGAVLRLAGVGGQVAERWGVEVLNLAAVAREAAAQLGHLESRRGRWTVAVKDLPNACAVLDLATARAGRVSPTHRERLERIRRKLSDVAEHERVRRRLVAFLAEPRRPVDVRGFMERAGPAAL